MMEYWNTGMMGYAKKIQPINSNIPLPLLYTWWNFMAGNSRHVSGPP